MKGSEAFTQTIKNYLEQRAATDELFAITYKKENKTLEGCINYIFSTVKATGQQGFADDEIYNMAVHYYDEDSIKDGKKENGTVVVNHHIELTKAEIEAAKQKALREITEREIRKLTPIKKPTEAPKTKPAASTPNKAEVKAQPAKKAPVKKIADEHQTSLF